MRLNESFPEKTRSSRVTLKIRSKMNDPSLITANMTGLYQPNKKLLMKNNVIVKDH